MPRRVTLTGKSYTEQALGGFLGLKHGTALVGTAFGTGAMRQLTLMAVGALGKSGGGQKIVGAAFGRAGLGVAAFRVRHGKILSVVRIAKALVAGAGFACSLGL